MALSGIEQASVQSKIDAASKEERQQMYADAENTLAQINMLISQKILSRQESMEGDLAIEVLMRVEATGKDKGWWFRAKRRVQLTQMYLGS